MQVIPPVLVANPFSDTLAEGGSVQDDFLSHVTTSGEEVWISSIDGQPLEAGQTITTSHGGVINVLSDSGLFPFRYSGNPSYYGDDSFSYTATDSWGET